MPIDAKTPEVPLAPSARPAGEPANTALIPVSKLEEDCYDWWRRHGEVLALKDRLRPQIVMIGDSITHFWGGRPESDRVAGAEAWHDAFGELPVLNLGFGWDRTQNVLWRLDHGEFDDLAPRRVVINIGTNNINPTPAARGNSAPEIVAGILAVCDRVRGLSPASRIIVMALFPRGERPDDPFRPKIKAINETLAQALRSRPEIAHLDIGPQFLRANGTLPQDLMPDGTHPAEKGYHLWAQALLRAGIRD